MIGCLRALPLQYITTGSSNAIKVEETSRRARLDLLTFGRTTSSFCSSARVECRRSCVVGRSWACSLTYRKSLSSTAVFGIAFEALARNACNEALRLAPCTLVQRSGVVRFTHTHRLMVRETLTLLQTSAARRASPACSNNPPALAAAMAIARGSRAKACSKDTSAPSRSPVDQRLEARLKCPRASAGLPTATNSSRGPVDAFG